jgi:hypothetical protein
MMYRTLILATLVAAPLAGSAFAGSPAPATTPAAAPKPASTPKAITHVTGVVKSVDATAHTLTVTVNGHDSTYNVSSLKLDPAVKAGASIDLTFSGSSVTGVALHH